MQSQYPIFIYTAPLGATSHTAKKSTKMWKPIFALLFATSLFGNSASTSRVSKIDTKLLHQRSGKDSNVFVSFVGGTTAALDTVNARNIENREQRLNLLHSSLLENAAKSQRDVLTLLKSQPDIHYKSFWITNQVYIKNATGQLISVIAQDPQVESIHEEAFGRMIKSVEERSVNDQEDGKWGVVKIQAHETWSLTGNNGQGVIVASIDTGARITHEAIKDNFIGDYGWFDPGLGTLVPEDTDGHGTHVTGIIAGSNGIGVAPGAKWASCRMCSTDECPQSEFVACGQFFACPTLANGTGSNCAKAPHVVSNSWGWYEGGTFLDAVIRAWHVGGVIPVFANGNGGPNCSTTSYPAELNVIAVGATEFNDAIGNFSSLGPSRDGVMKPDISAPGRLILSASNNTDDGYVLKSGTSMACPHVAGVVALIQSSAGNKTLSYEQIKSRLMGNTDRNLTFSGLACGNISDNVFPNNVFGYGRVNALKSVQGARL